MLGKELFRIGLFVVEKIGVKIRKTRLKYGKQRSRSTQMGGKGLATLKEGRRYQTSCEPKGSQFVRQAGIFQNGRNTSAERSPLPRRLDDESRSERCVLRHSPQLPGQETPEVPMARETVPV